MIEYEYLSFDPGDSSGWAGFNSDGTLADFGTCIGLDALTDQVQIMSAKVYVIEEYRLYRQKALQQSGSKLLTVQAIGIIKAEARRNRAKVVEQPAAIKKVAEMWTGYKPSGDHKHSHFIDAINHGLYYLHKEGIVETKAVKDE